MGHCVHLINQELMSIECVSRPFGLWSPGLPSLLTMNGQGVRGQLPGARQTGAVLEEGV